MITLYGNGLMTDVCTLEAVQAVGTAMLEKSHLVEGLGAVGLAHHIPNLGDFGMLSRHMRRATLGIFQAFEKSCPTDHRDLLTS